MLEFEGGTIKKLSDLSFSQVGADTVISYAHNTNTITLVGVGLEDLMAHQTHDFLFV